LGLAEPELDGLVDAPSLSLLKYSSRMLSLKLTRVAIGTVSRVLSSYRMAWIACCTLAEGMPS